MTRSRILLALAVAAAVVCAATGRAYDSLVDDSNGSNGLLFFLTGLGHLGAAALIAVGWWQHRAVRLTRIVVLIALGVLAAGYSASNLIGLSIPLIEDGERFVRPPQGLHVAGLVSGALLYFAVLVEATFAIRDERRASPA